MVLIVMAWPATAPGEPLLILEKSSNANRVVYEVDPSRPEPVHAFWEMLAEDGHVEELNSFERARIYGVTVSRHDSRGVTFTFKALPEYPVTGDY